MPISNNTDEKVGVEVSGPTANAGEKAAYVLLAGGALAIAVGALAHKPILVGLGLALALVGAGVLWRARRAARRLARPVALQTRGLEPIEFPIVLDPKQELDDPDNFHNRSVSLFKVKESNVFGEQIARVDFSADDYTISYYQDGTELLKVTEPEKIAPDPVRINLHKIDSQQYKIFVQPGT